MTKVDPFTSRMSVGADVGWTVIFSIMIINAIIGNIVVFWIVLCKFGLQPLSSFYAHGFDFTLKHLFFVGQRL